MTPLPRTLTKSPSHRALWDKVMKGFKYISGRDWKQHADYPHFWPLVNTLYKMAYGDTAVLPDNMKLPLMFMYAGHAGRTRKGLRARPYFHHVLMVVYLTWVLDLPRTVQLAAINHDDVEDVPKNIGVSPAWVSEKVYDISPFDAYWMVHDLTNKPHPDGKHAGQVDKMGEVDKDTGTLKLLDRVANLYDMRLDKPKDFGPERIAQECHNAWDLACAMKEPADEPVLALMAFAITLLERENSLPPQV